MEKIVPWYSGFTGKIKPTVKYSMNGVEQPVNKLKCEGIIKKTSKTTIEIRELPVGTSTDKYIEFLRELLRSKPSEADHKNSSRLIQDFKEISVTKEQMKEIETAGGLSRFFRLTSTINGTNMVIFDAKGHLRHYKSPLEIIDKFFDVQMDYYKSAENYKTKCASWKQFQMGLSEFNLFHTIIFY